MLAGRKCEYFVTRRMDDVSLTMDVLLSIVPSVSWSITLILRLSPYELHCKYSIHSSCSKRSITLEAVMSDPGKVPPARTALVMCKRENCIPPGRQRRYLLASEAIRRYGRVDNIEVGDWANGESPTTEGGCEGDKGNERGHGLNCHAR